MTIKEGIKAILLAGGKVGFSYKKNQKDWFNTVHLCAIEPMPPRRTETFYVSRDALQLDIDTTDVDEAVEKYCAFIFTKKNIGLAYQGIRRHRLTDEDFDDLSSQKISALVQRYWKEYWHLDYPEFAGADSTPNGG